MVQLRLRKKHRNIISVMPTKSPPEHRPEISELKASSRGLQRYDDLPHWRQDNHYILGFYRSISNSYAISLASVLRLHNESVNIWTHLFGAAGFALIWLGFASSHSPLFSTLPSIVRMPPSFTSADAMAFGCFFGGAVICLGISATYHTISNHSPRVNRLGNQLDYVGIVALIWGSFVTSVYYGHYCEKELQWIYWGMVCSKESSCALRRFFVLISYLQRSLHLVPAVSLYL